MSDIRIKMAKDLRDMSDMVGDLHWMAAKAVEDLIKKDARISEFCSRVDYLECSLRAAYSEHEETLAELARRDARIVELENAAESLRISRDYHHEQEVEYRRRWAGLYAAPVSEAKAQGVVMPERETELFNAAYGAAVESGWESVKCMARQIWDAARLNAAPVQRATKAEISQSGCRCVRYGEGNPHWPCPLHSAPVQQPKCQTCNDNGMIGGPSFYAPDEGGEPCPHCAAAPDAVEVLRAVQEQFNRFGERFPDGFDGRIFRWVDDAVAAYALDAPVQQVSVPGGWRELLRDIEQFFEGAGVSPGPDIELHMAAMLAAAPAAPAADAGHVFYGMDGNHP